MFLIVYRGIFVA